MYFEFFGFNRPPFALTPDTAQYVNLQNHQSCFDTVLFGIDQGEGFIKIIGDVGTGKTMICRKLLRYLEEHSAYRDVDFVFIANPVLSPLGLYRAMAAEMKLDLHDSMSAERVLELIQQQLLYHQQQQTSMLVIVDEAQALPPETLEALRLLTNIETETRKLIQVVLFAQPELDRTLKKEAFRQLRQRITFSYYLTPLTRAETQSYLNHRILKAGYHGGLLFTPEVIRKLYFYSKGIPRLLNILAHKALLCAFARNRHTLTVADVRRAWKDSRQEVTVSVRSGTNPWQLIYALLLFLIGGLTWLQIYFGGGF